MSGVKDVQSKEGKRKVNDADRDIDEPLKVKKKLSRTELLDERWQEKYDELLEFHKENGHFNVPQSSNRALEGWMYRQRMQYHKILKCYLTPYRINALEAINFDWARSKVQVKENQQICRMKIRSRTRVRGDKSTERTRSMSGVKDVQSKEGKRKVNDADRDIDEPLKVKKRLSRTELSDEKWQKNYDELLEFHKENGHFNVPQSLNRALEGWIYRQRMQYHKILKCYLTPYRINALEAINFDWTRSKEQEKKKNTKTKLTKLEIYEKAWQDKYKKLVGYHQKYGHTNVSRSDKILGRWVHNQRMQHNNKRKNLLTPSRIAALEKLNFQWNGLVIYKEDCEMIWHGYYHQLEEFKEKYGHIRPSEVDLDQKLLIWMKRQVILYRNNTIKQGRFEALEKLDFFNEMNENAPNCFPEDEETVDDESENSQSILEAFILEDDETVIDESENDESIPEALIVKEDVIKEEIYNHADEDKMSNNSIAQTVPDIQSGGGLFNQGKESDKTFKTSENDTNMQHDHEKIVHLPIKQTISVKDIDALKDLSDFISHHRQPSQSTFFSEFDNKNLKEAPDLMESPLLKLTRMHVSLQEQSSSHVLQSLSAIQYSHVDTECQKESLENKKEMKKSGNADKNRCGQKKYIEHLPIKSTIAINAKDARQELLDFIFCHAQSVQQTSLTEFDNKEFKKAQTVMEGRLNELKKICNSTMDHLVQVDSRVTIHKML